MIEKTLDYVGMRVTDIITGFEGVVSSVTFDLYGCVQCIVTPPAKDGKTGDAAWFDIKRLKTGKRVMARPDYSAIKFGKEIGAGDRPQKVPS